MRRKNKIKDKSEKRKEENLEKIFPYHLVPSKKDKENQLARFMEIFKQLEIKSPLSEAIQQLSTYAKFLKNLLTKKRKYVRPEKFN